MMESRKAITQLMDTIKSIFTEEENKLDIKKSEKPLQIQNNRNAYAKWLVEEQRRLAEEAAAKAAKETEKNELTANYTSMIVSQLLTILARKKEAITNSFNAITLDNFDEKEAGLRAMKTEFTGSMTDVTLPNIPAKYHLPEEVEVIKFDTKDLFDFDSRQKDFTIQLSALKHSLIGRLLSKKEELEEVENLRIQAEQAEVARKAALEAANEKQKEELAKKQQQEREEEQRKAAEMENNKLLREAEERARLEAEAEEKRIAAEQAIEIEKAAKNAETLFNQVSEATTLGSAPVARHGYSITVQHQAGWVEMFTFWYGKEGVALSLPELEKKTFKQIKTFCEKMAKDGEMIDSKFLKYTAEVKAVNKK